MMVTTIHHRHQHQPPPTKGDGAVHASITLEIPAAVNSGVDDQTASVGTEHLGTAHRANHRLAIRIKPGHISSPESLFTHTHPEYNDHVHPDFVAQLC